MSITVMQGDLLRQDDVDAIVNTVNCVGVMGKGIALQFKNKWPANFTAYAAACKAGEVRPGRMFMFDTGGLLKPNFIINFPTKDHWRAPSKIEYIRDGLQDMLQQMDRLGIQSVAIPPLGCGNGGLNWAEVRPMIESAFAVFPHLSARLFEPAGAPAAKEMEVRTAPPKMTRGRAAILKLLDVYRDLNYGLSKIEVQKLAYFLQTAGENLTLKFVKHKFGPYSDALRHALERMDGHYIHGLGDGVVESDIEPTAAALAQADAFIQNAELGLQQHVNRVAELIEGYQSPYGMELLATVHWVAHYEADVRDVDSAFAAIQKWNPRKRQLMRQEHVAAAWHQLEQHGWLH